MTEFDPAASCTGKQQHDSSTARKIAKRYPDATAYKCPFCGHWHLAHRLRRKRRMKAL